MKLISRYNNQEGFTLVEIIAVLIILGILAAVAVPRYINLETNAKARAIDAGISELNGRENLVWANVKIGSPAPTSVSIDNDVWSGLGGPAIDLGADYDWTAAPAQAGGSLEFQAATAVVLTRTAATLDHPGNWVRP